jgi:pimeloyl-ACP methyl ester carboxylesterase
VNLVYHRRGAGRPILFIHGATLDHRMWQPQVDALADRFACIAYDVRGYGASPPPDGPFKHCEDAAALIDHLALERPVVVGHSIGALYALELAFLRPLAGLVLVCMSGLLPFPDKLSGLLAKVRHVARTDGVDAAKAVWRTTGWVDTASPAVADMQAGYSGWYWTHDSPSKNLEPPVVTRLEEVAVPTVIVDGGRDTDYNHAVATELMRIPGSKLVRLPHAGHVANLDEPDAVSESIAALAGG